MKKLLVLFVLHMLAINGLSADFSGDPALLGEPANLITSSPESKLTSALIDGIPAFCIGDESGGKMAYFRVENPSLQRGLTPDITITFLYFDDGTGEVLMVYDSADLSFVNPGQSPGVWKPVGKITLTNSKKWKTTSWTVYDAQFSNRCNGNDFRLEASQPFTIAGAYLRSALPIDQKGLLKVGIDQGSIANWSPGSEVSFDLSTKNGINGFLSLHYSAPEPFVLHYEIPGLVPETEVEMLASGDWETFGSLVIGNLDLPAGNHKLILRNKNQPSFMQLRSVSCSTAEPPPFSTEFPALYNQPVKTFVEAMIQLRKHAANPKIKAIAKGTDLFLNMKDGATLTKQFPVETDWFLQDNQVHGEWGKGGYDARRDYTFYINPDRDNSLEQKLIQTVLSELNVAQLTEKFNELVEQNISPDEPQWLALYIEACRMRRTARLAPLLAETKQIIYATHMNMGTIYLATEHQGCPDGSQLRKIDLTPEAEGQPLIDELLFDSNHGIVRDSELSFDANKLLFAWRKTTHNTESTGRLSPETGNYKIYEMDLATRELRPLTTDETYGADIEPCYLPDGNIMFSSQRCVHEVTCGWGDCSNLFIMDGDGKYARRVGYDQTQTAFPHLLNDGRVVYTRRDYNDRGQSFGHATFIMNPDGTSQTEYYGNNSSAPTSIQHIRPIPGSSKTMGIAGGYHTTQGGKLVTIDVSKGRQNYDGLSFYNWDPTPLLEVNNENYCRVGEQFTYPYPLSENSLLVSFSPIGAYMTGESGVLDASREQGLMLYNLYYMTLDGRRELLAAHPTLSCTQAIPLRSRTRPSVRPSLVDYTKDTAVCYVQNVYYGPSAEGIEPKSIKKLRVVKLFYKPITIGGGIWAPPHAEVGPGRKYAGYGNHSVLPTGVGTASWDTKQILGEVDVHSDGSAMFEIPARTPVYFQLIDAKGEVVQTMRSWATLMPKENFSCVGCHEENDSAPLPQASKSLAMKKPPQKLKPLYDLSGEPFSYAKNVQPIWNKHCVSCHAPGKKAASYDLSDTLVSDYPNEKQHESTRRKFYQSYLTLLDVKWKDHQGGKRLDEGRPNDIVNHLTRMSKMELIPPYYAGSIQSGLMKFLRDGHGKTKLTDKEIETVAAWIDLNVPYVGEYDEMNIWDDATQELYRSKMEMRRKQEVIEQENIHDYIQNGMN